MARWISAAATLESTPPDSPRITSSSPTCRRIVSTGFNALAVAAAVGSVIGAYYYIKIVKVMYFDEAAAPFARLKEPVQGGLILLAALAVSPLGYLLIGPLSGITDRAAGSIF